MSTSRALRAATLAAALLLPLTLAGCEQPVGVVAERETETKPRNGKNVVVYELDITLDAGGESELEVPRAVYDRCQVGQRWPDCSRR